jgi:hypothetical protein
MSTSTNTDVCDTLGNLQTFDYGSTSSTTYENLADRILEHCNFAACSTSFILFGFITIYICYC